MSFKSKQNYPIVGDYLKGDLLNRQVEVDFILKIINESKQGLSLAIDGSWGSGKTWFGHSVRSKLNEKANASVYINTWESDFSQDPFASLASEFYKSLQDLSSKSQRKALLRRFEKIVSSASKNIVGKLKTKINKIISKSSLELVDVLEIIKIINDSKSGELYDSIQLHNNYMKFVEDFKSLLADATKEIISYNKIDSFVILVDELDRCKPTYAIEFLERVKHLFIVPGVVFVFLTNLQQLESSIKAVYGETFKSREYLKRFFDLIYELPQNEAQSFVIAKVREYEILELANQRTDEFVLEGSQGTFSQSFTILAKYYELTLRDIEQALMRTKVVLKFNQSTSNLNPIAIAFLVILHHHNQELLERIDKGEVSILDLFSGFLKSKVGTEFAQSYYGRYLYSLFEYTHNSNAGLQNQFDTRITNWADILPIDSNFANNSDDNFNYMVSFKQPFSNSRYSFNEFSKWVEVVKLSKRFT